ncbi:basic helix-loop-helix protein [Marasmius crinis-equi]|uniref:Basic helix-loop-helix protein n=1 Tax=Marasmius crinis-equi TaxID=585013 RepID=A0ABR3FMN9_9AGAR
MGPNTTDPVLPPAPATAAATTAPAPSQPAQPPAPGNAAIPQGYPALDRDQLIQLLQHIPGLMPKLVSADGTIKEDAAAQALSNLQQSAFTPGATAPPGSALPAVVLPQGLAPPGTFPPGFPATASEPGPNSHPRGPPNLGHLTGTQIPPVQPLGPSAPGAEDDDGEMSDGKGKDEGSPSATPTAGSNRRAGRNGAAMGSDEWTRQRKDNHKEVERRRRSNINEGINELGRIVPNGSGEKSKGAILSRAVQYIHHLKENEARNIEKWTLEKLLMDQAMGDLQAQLEEVRNMWTEERNQRQKIELELETLKNGGTLPPGAAEKVNGAKRPSEDAEPEKEDDSKRQRTE